MENVFINLKCTDCGHKFQETLDWFEQVGQKQHKHYDNTVPCIGKFKEINDKEFAETK